jgi:hypothetical protein
VKPLPNLPNTDSKKEPRKTAFKATDHGILIDAADHGEPKRRERFHDSPRPPKASPTSRRLVGSTWLS